MCAVLVVLRYARVVVQLRPHHDHLVELRHVRQVSGTCGEEVEGGRDEDRCVMGGRGSDPFLGPLHSHALRRYSSEYLYTSQPGAAQPPQASPHFLSTLQTCC